MSFILKYSILVLLVSGIIQSASASNESGNVLQGSAALEYREARANLLESKKYYSENIHKASQNVSQNVATYGEWLQKHITIIKEDTDKKNKAEERCRALGMRALYAIDGCSIVDFWPPLEQTVKNSAPDKPLLPSQPARLGRSDSVNLCELEFFH